MYKIFSQSTLAAALALLAIQSQSVFPRGNVVASASSGEASHLRGRPGFDTLGLGLGEEEATSANVFGIGSLASTPRRKLAEGSHEDDGADHGDAHDMVVHVTYEHIYAIFVFLITATALGIFTSKLGMVSYIFCETTCAFMI